MNLLGRASISIDEILFRVELLCREKSRAVVAIDGRGGAGKSSLARTLVANLSKSVHIEHDWFHLPKSQVIGPDRFDHARLISELLLPFRSGSPKLTF